MLASSVMDYHLYSLRMRASRKGKHVSGAERIVTGGQILPTSNNLIARAFNLSGNVPTEVHFIAEQIDPEHISYMALPNVTTWNVSSWQQGRSAAAKLLEHSGIGQSVISQAFKLLTNGPSPSGGVMRGAVLLDAITGQRLETDLSRGIRVSRMDLAPEYSERIKAQLSHFGLAHHRTLEALILAGKVVGAPGLLAELCWSDDPEYQVGYVSDGKNGYQRISMLKPVGDPMGGRVFFVNRAANSRIDTLVSYLENQVVLFNQLGTVHPPKNWIS
ncbi:MAG: 6-carboxyhexanoate--CoA ligase [Deltaproteobacteria bacterium]|nr:6-carboxyhexanoate--CoA ligase [Deltaproteobacteria bacterium]MBW2503894.1 6-carboxyhexanoate--CoA ligase [Deltaproteobacteria bacterium]MBW2520895.1 6-carboxyhexanoate--CoA ligase [Deltaproteobacteria bacterium]